MAHRIAQPPDDLRQHVAALYAQYAERVRRTVARALRPADQHHVDDLTQDVWLTVWERAVLGEDITHPAALLANTARRLVAAHYRTTRRQTAAGLDTRELVAA